MDLGVAGLTQTHEVVPCVSAAFRNGQDVMNFLYRDQPPFLEAHLTEGMLRRIAVTDAFPRSAVFAVDIGAALVFVVLAAFFHTVLFTKLSFTEVGAAGVRAGPEWSLGHLLTSFGYKKSPTGFDSHEARSIFSSHYNDIIKRGCIIVAFSGLFRRNQGFSALHPGLCHAAERPIGGCGTGSR